MLSLAFDPYNLVLALLFSMVLQAVFFVFAAWLKTDKVTDLTYSLTFFLMALGLLLNRTDASRSHVLLAFMVIFWAFRLGSYLLRRIIFMGKDARFDGIRENFFSFLLFWFFQGLTVWVTMLPVIFALSVDRDLPSGTAMSIGSGIWLVGLIIESVADQQKFNFKSREENKGRWIDSGLWKYSRHPNYFGEMLVWWGIFIATVPILQDWNWVLIVGPIFICCILLFFSGIPPLERKYSERYKGNAEFQNYRKRTSLLIPWPPARS